MELTPEQQAKLAQLNTDYPCDKRDGWASKGCSCVSGVEADTTRVKCRYLGGSVKVKNCFDCPHQKAYKRLIEKG